MPAQNVRLFIVFSWPPIKLEPKAETSRHNKAYEGIQSALAAETARHNVATEGINWYSAQNLANLQFAQANKTTSEVGETTRHNLATESIQSGQLEETGRHNLATEQYNINALGEQFRHNKQTELQGWISTGAGAYKDVSTGLRQNVESVSRLPKPVNKLLLYFDASMVVDLPSSLAIACCCARLLAVS